MCDPKPCKTSMALLIFDGYIKIYWLKLGTIFNDFKNEEVLNSTVFFLCLFKSKNLRLGEFYWKRHTCSLRTVEVLISFFCNFFLLLFLLNTLYKRSQMSLRSGTFWCVSVAFTIIFIDSADNNLRPIQASVVV